MTSKRILVVEDEAIVARSIETGLQRLGYVVPAIAMSGEEAIQQAISEQPDLVLMDIHLQGEMDGIEAARRIRADLDIPVIYLTAYVGDATLRQAKLSEPFGYLVKPFRVEELGSTIEMALYKHEMERKLKESETRYRALSELTSDFAYSIRVEPDGTSVPEWATAAHARITDFIPGEFADPNGWERVVHPDDLPLFHQQQKRLLSGQPDVSEYRIVTRAGETHWLRHYGQPVWDEAEGRVVRIYGAAQDVTERRQAEEALQTSQAELWDLYENAPNAYFSIGLDGRIRRCNRRASELLGYPGEELVGKPVSELYADAPQGKEKASRIFEKFVAGETITDEEMLMQMADGTPLWISLSVNAIRDARGQIVESRSSAVDITARKQAEEALRQRTAELQARNEELDAFAHTVAHDLQNPLGMIIGFADLLEQRYATLPAEDVAQSLRTMVRSGHKMSNIIHELLLLSSVRGVDVDVQPLDMARIVTEARLRLARPIQEHQAEIVVPDAWPKALGYAPWIEEVWVNYLSNAIKYGGRPPRVELGAVVQAGGADPPAARFWVRDNGPGLTPEEQARLFVPFTRLAQASAKGHGLGLSIVRRIVEKLGGEVGVESTGMPGQGSLFFFTLPAVIE